MYAKRAELKVGILVLAASVAMLTLLVFATGDSLWKQRREVHFRLQVGDLAPAQGDPIYVSGVKIGKVGEVRFRTETREGDQLSEGEKAAIRARGEAEGREVPLVVREVFVQVIGEVDADQVLPTSTQAELSESVTGIRRLTLILGDSPEDLPEGSTLEKPIVIYQAPGLSSLSDSVGQVMRQAGDAVQSADETLVEVRELVKELKARVGGKHLDRILEDLQETAASLRVAGKTIEGSVSGLGDDIGEAVADVKRLAASGARMLEGLEKDVPGILEDVRGVVARLDGILESAGPQVDSFLADMARTGENLASLSEEFAGIGPDAQALIQGVGGDVETLIEVLTDTARNLLDASEDLRSHPWKLLNEPSPDEIAYDNLRLTTQSYVRAMQKMQETARTLKEVVARGDAQDPVVQALVRRTLAEFQSSVDRYRVLERRLVELLQQNAPPASRGAGPAVPAPPGPGRPPR